MILIDKPVEFVRRNDFLILIYCAIGISLPVSVTANAFFLILLLAYSVYNRIRGKQKPESDARPIPLFILILFFLIYAMGLSRSWNFSAGFFQLVKIFSLIAIPVSLLLTGRRFSLDQIQAVCFGFLGACLMLSLLCYVNALYNIVDTSSVKVLNEDRDYYYFSYVHLTGISGMDPIYLSMYCNFCLVFIFAGTMHHKGWKVFLIIYLTIFILLIASKIGILCLLFTVVLILAMKSKLNYKMLILYALVLGGAVVSVLQITFLRQRFMLDLEYDYGEARSSGWNSASQRMAIWSCARESIRETPFLIGHGTDNGDRVLHEKFKEKGYIRGFEDNLNAHNQLVETFLDTGMIGVGILLVLLFFPLPVAIRTRDWLFILFLLMTLEYFLVESVLSRQKGVVFFALFYSMLSFRKTEDPRA